MENKFLHVKKIKYYEIHFYITFLSGIKQCCMSFTLMSRNESSLKIFERQVESFRVKQN